MKIEVEYRTDPESVWRSASGFPSLNAAKTYCRHMRKPGGKYGSVRPEIQFKIYIDDKLHSTNKVNGSWRMQWKTH